MIVSTVVLLQLYFSYESMFWFFKTQSVLKAAMLFKFLELTDKLFGAFHSQRRMLGIGAASFVCARDSMTVT